MAQFKRINIGNNPYAYYDTAVVDRNAGTLVFASVVGYSSVINNMTKEINKQNNLYLEDLNYVRSVSQGYKIEKRKQNNSDFMHAVIYRKDVIQQEPNGDEKLFAYIFYRNEEERNARIYDKFYEHTAVPIIREWIPYIYTQLVSGSYARALEVYYDRSNDNPRPLNCIQITILVSQLRSIVSNGLRGGHISVHGTNTVSDTMRDMTGLDDYLNSFGEGLAQRVQESFTPRFVPGVSEYSDKVNDYDDACFDAGIEIFDAQKDVIQASVNNLDQNNVTFVIGEMGTGKTLIGSGIAYAHHKGEYGLVSTLMCPSHLTKKWKREWERFVPNGKGYILKSLSDLKAIESKIKNKKRRENMLLIISKESAKFGYEMRPSVRWSVSDNTFVCPECGKPLMKTEFIGSGRSREMIRVKFTKEDMCKEYAFNLTCDNNVRVWDKTERVWKNETCNAKLWTPLNREDENDTGWIKLGAEGWFRQDHITELYNFYASMNNIPRKQAQLLVKLAEKQIELQSTGEMKSSTRGPKKYPLAKYIKNYYKGYIDYFIGDELHLYKGDTEQGQAFGDLAMAAKKVIGLTGTLLNGYADGLFYILYRTVPRLMQKEGFGYKDEAEFMRAFGVIKKTSRFTLMASGRQGNKIGSTEKRLPGVSPLVFTKFLLENAVFLSLSDMSEGLPEYQEIPMAIDMDVELQDAYARLERELRSCSSIRGEGGVKTMGALLQTLSVYPDMPYDQPPILHPDTGNVLVVPPELERGLRNKEQALLELVQGKIAGGEKVLVYYQWTNRTDLAEKLSRMFVENGVQCAVLESRVAPDKREEWIEARVQEGIEVVICNPTLVETGLDLLDFTTIVFYQMGYNIFTMRQASRRSWRLSQTRSIEVYFMYYGNTIQEQALSLMATKLQASMAIEGRFSEEGLRAMSNNEDLLTQIANSVVQGIQHTVNAEVFRRSGHTAVERPRRERKSRRDLEGRASHRLTLSYFRASEKQTVTPTPTHKVMSALFSDKQHIANLF